MRGVEGQRIIYIQWSLPNSVLQDLQYPSSYLLLQSHSTHQPYTMQTTIALLAFAAPAILALPSAYTLTHASDFPSVEDIPLVPMKWIGYLSLDETTNTTLYGPSADAIYAQILALNPSYTPWAFPDFRADMHAKGITREMFDSGSAANKRRGMSPNPAAVLKRDDGSFDCNNGAWVWWQDCQEGLNTLYAMGGGYSHCAVDGGGQNKCTRFSCL